MAKKGVSKKTGLVQPLIKEGSKKSKEVIKNLGIEKELSPAAPAEEVTSTPIPKEDKKTTPHVPIPTGNKNIGALTATEINPADVEKVASMEPDALKKHLQKNKLEPKFVDAVLKRHIEIQSSKPKEVEPSVLRDPKTGRALPRVPAAPTGVRSPDPKAPGQRLTAVTGETIRPATNTELRRGIPSVVVRDQTRPTQPAGPNLPRIGQRYKHSDGRVMRVTAENIAEIHEDAKRTVLPTAGPEVMQPQGRPTPLPGPRGGLRPNVPKNNRGNRAGLGAAHSVVKEHADRALGHLDAMAAAQHGTGPYKQAQRSFQVVHKAIGEKNMSPSIHNMLQLAHNHIDSKLPGTDKMLNATKEAVGDTLRAGKKAEEERTFRQIQTDRGGN